MNDQNRKELSRLVAAYDKDCTGGMSMSAGHAAWEALVRFVESLAEAAHAEGRRSAMEELHPQWLKEKERLDWVIRRALLCTNPWAEQQGRRARFDAVPGYDFGMDERYMQEMREAIDADIAADEWGVKSDAAQPLQQEGGKDWAPVLVSVIGNLLGAAGPSQRFYAADKARKVLAEYRATLPLPDNLQQASTAQGEPDGRNVHRPLLLARIKRYRDIFGCSLKEAKEACEYGRDMNSDESAFLSPPKETASTALVEPAKMECPTCGVDRFKKPCPNMADECPMVADAHLLKPADSATDDEPLSMSMFASLEELNAAKAARAAQVTPEGADLPRVVSAFRTELTDAELSDPEFTRAYIEGCNESFAEAMDEIKTLRAALAATTAEPVPVTMQQVVDAMHENNLLTDIGYTTLLNGDSLKATLEFITQIINYVPRTWQRSASE